MTNPASPQNFPVELPGGGRLQLQSAEEQELWNQSYERYLDEYHLNKNNDLILLGAVLQQQVLMFRAQRRLNGMVPEVDDHGVPTGRYRVEPVESDEMAAAMKLLTNASDQIRALEKSLGIDKATRESGGSITVENYIRTLKKAAHERGVHVAKRTLEYEEFVNGLRWRIRVLRNADAEDQAYHDISPEKILEWCRNELVRLEQVDKQFARERGKLFVGQL